MLSPRGGGGMRGTPGIQYVGHLTFQKNFWSKSLLWGPKFGQIGSNIPTLKTSSEKQSRLFTVPYFFRVIVDVDCWVRRAAILVSWCIRNWEEYKIPVGRGGGGHGRWTIFSALSHHSFNPISPTHGHFVLSPDQNDDPSDSTISWENRGLWTN